MEYDRRRIRLVLNRANTNVGIERQDILAILGRDADILVPSDREVTRSINQGNPIALQPRRAAGKAFRALAELYVRDADHAANGSGTPAPRRRRLFGRGQ
jgi:Flp pilus assembly CpaE family ATPase